MNRIYLLIFLIVIGVNNLKAQKKHLASFRVSVQDDSSRDFFSQHPDVDYVTIQFEKSKAVSLGVYYHKSSADVKDRVIESYAMDFEGHIYRLKQKYPQLNINKHAGLRVYSIMGIDKLGDSSLYFLGTTIRRDSTSYNFNFYTITGKIYDWQLTKRGRAALKGDIAELQQKFTRAYRSWKPIAVPDSVLFIKGLVEKDGSLGNVKLQIGAQSQFSENAIAFIKREASSWWPANSGRRIQYQATFFVRLNKDDSITFSVL